MNKNRFFKHNSEDGVALIFALAMLALLLIMLIGFLASTILEQRIAYSYKDDVGARLLARSALTRVKTLLRASDEYPDDLLWMRNGAEEETGKNDLLQPLVSMNKDSAKRATTDEPDSYKALKPLLKKYFGPSDAATSADIQDKWDWQNFLPKTASQSFYYPEWIYYYSEYNNDGTQKNSNTPITGRIAYVVVPNFGINLSLMENSSRKGNKFSELNPGFMVSDVAKLNKFKNWLSVDVLMGKSGLYSESGTPFSVNQLDIDTNFYAQAVGGKLESNTKGVYRELATLYLTTDEREFTAHNYFDITKLNKNGNTVEKFPAYTAFADWRSFLTNNFDLTGAQLDQVAANVTDYVDADSIPTSDVAPSTWLTAAAPTYTGNEKTPYINQIIPALQVSGSYTLTSKNSGLLNKVITQKATFTHKGKLYVELVNIYPDQLNFSKIVLKGLKMKLTRGAQVGTSLSIGSLDSFIPSKTLDDVSVDLTVDEVVLEPTEKSVSANGYAVVGGDVTFDGTIPTITNETTQIRLLPDPKLNVTFKLSGCEFERAVLVGSDDSNGVDYVKSLSADNLPKDLTGAMNVTDDNTGLLPDTDNTYAWIFASNGEKKTVSAYLSFSANDPRLNLEAAEWKAAFERNTDDFDTAKIPDYGAANDEADAKNDDPAEEKDLEVDKDPANLSNAYIRNGAMESMAELGLIHRGKAWQTFNLRSMTADPDLTAAELATDKLTYKNDVRILERYRMDTSSDFKFNINHPANMSGAFAPLVDNMTSHGGSANPETAGTVLSDDAKKELRQWLANKCYKADGAAPKDATNVYDRYVRHVEVANVVADWAVNGDKSPLKGNVTDCGVEELVSQIVHLVYFGDMFEYYTVFAVAQTIKDMGGTIYSYKDDGTLDSTSATKGVLDDSDIITSEAFLVARVRRTISCQPLTDGTYLKSCLKGRHRKSCSKSVQVLECYVLSEL